MEPSDSTYVYYSPEGESDERGNSTVKYITSRTT